jgi:hypothetical protein
LIDALCIDAYINAYIHTYMHTWYFSNVFLLLTDDDDRELVGTCQAVYVSHHVGTLRKLYSAKVGEPT